MRRIKLVILFCSIFLNGLFAQEKQNIAGRFKLLNIDSISFPDHNILLFSDGVSSYKVISEKDTVCLNKCVKILKEGEVYELILDRRDFLRHKNGISLIIYPNGIISDKTGKGISKNEKFYYCRNIIDLYILYCP